MENRKNGMSRVRTSSHEYCAREPVPIDEFFEEKKNQQKFHNYLFWETCFGPKSLDNIQKTMIFMKIHEFS